MISYILSPRILAIGSRDLSSKGKGRVASLEHGGMLHYGLLITTKNLMIS